MLLHEAVGMAPCLQMLLLLLLLLVMVHHLHLILLLNRGGLLSEQLLLLLRMSILQHLGRSLMMSKRHAGQVSLVSARSILTMK